MWFKRLLSEIILLNKLLGHTTICLKFSVIEEGSVTDSDLIEIRTRIQEKDSDPNFIFPNDLKWIHDTKLFVFSPSFKKSIQKTLAEIIFMYH